MEALVEMALQKELEVRNATNLVRAVAKMKREDTRLLSLLQVQRMGEHTPQDASNTLRALAALLLSSELVVGETCAACAQKSFACEPKLQEPSNAMRAPAKLRADKRPPPEMSGSAFLARLAEANAQDPASFARASAAQAPRFEPPLRGTAALLGAPERSAASAPQDVGNALRAPATLEVPGAPALASPGARFVCVVKECGPQDTGNAVRSFATLLAFHGPVMQAASTASHSRSKALSLQNSANVGRSFGQLAALGRAPLGSLGDGFRERMDIEPCNLQNFAAMSRAFAALQLQAAFRELLESEKAGALARWLEDFGQEVANLVWACGSTQAIRWPLMEAAARSVCQAPSTLQPQEPANLARGPGKTFFQDVPLMEAPADAALAKVEDFGPQGPANLAWAFSACAVRPETCLEATRRQFHRLKPTSLDAQDTSNLLRSLATLEPGGEADEALSQAIFDTLGQLLPQNIANSMRALATMSKRRRRLTGALVSAAKGCLTPTTAPQNTSNVGRALATVQPLEEASMDDSAANFLATGATELDPQGVTNLARRSAQLVTVRAPLMALAGDSVFKFLQGRQLEGQHPANSARALARLKAEVPLLGAVAELELPSLSMQSCVDLHWSMTVFGLAPKDPSMSTAAMGLVEALGAALVRDVEDYAQLIQEHQVLNLRSFTWPLLSSLGVPSPSGGAFAARAREALRARFGFRSSDSRVFAYLEYVLVPLERGEVRRQEEISGVLAYESGYTADEAPSFEAPLVALQLPNSRHVRRELCAEFQGLKALCRLLAPWESAAGVVSVFTSISPCLSCVSALWQFRLRFPEVSLDACDDQLQAD
ncbi:unnamed protein product [Effrenium voratum]|nr:unnamed protein product [Effrenium voratum]